MTLVDRSCKNQALCILEFFHTMSRFACKWLGREIHKILSGLQKGFQAAPGEAARLLTVWKNMVNKRYNERLPEIRKRLINAVWYNAEANARKFEAKADQLIAQIHSTALNRIRKVDLSIESDCTLNGIEMTHPEYDEHIVLLGGMGYLWQHSFTFLYRLHTGIKANIHTYNYRGTTKAIQGDLTEEAIIQDAVKIVQDLRTKGVPDRKISIYGRSLGGGAAACTAATLAEAGIHVRRLMSERSFRSLPKAAGYMLPAGGTHLAQFVLSCGYEFPAEEKIAKLSQETEIILIYHKKDRVIPLPVALKTALDENPIAHLKVKHVEMQDDGVPPWEYANIPFAKLLENHCRDYTDSELEEIATHFRATVAANPEKAVI